MKNNINKKGFTLVELMVVVAIVGILGAILIPSMMHYVLKARKAAAIADTRVIKTAIETSLIDHLALGNDGAGGAFNKRVYTKYASYSDYKDGFGAFTNISWYAYRTNKNVTGPSFKIDKVIAKALDEQFTEVWETGKDENPLKYSSTTKTCQDYLDEQNTNFGLVVIYNRDATVRMVQLYRKHILVTYVNGEYLVNMEDDAHFIGTNYWSTVYTDIGETAPEELKALRLSDHQYTDGKRGNWFN